MMFDLFWFLIIIAALLLLILGVVLVPWLVGIMVVVGIFVMISYVIANDDFRENDE